MYALLYTRARMPSHFTRGAVVDCVLAASDVRLFASPPLSDRDEITCFRCGERNHIKSECLHWKTRLCWHHTNSYCTKTNCPFAHGEAELRTPWSLRCVRILRTGNGGFVDIGCGGTDHSFRNCPASSGVALMRPTDRCAACHDARAAP